MSGSISDIDLLALNLPGRPMIENSPIPPMAGEKIDQLDWEDLRFFAAFAAAGGLSAAARRLGVEHATVSRRIEALETRLGLKLVDRRGRRLTLTPEGDALTASIERMSDASRAIERLAAGARSEIRGTVTISAPATYAARVLAPRLSALSRRHPELQLALLGQAETASLDRRDADLALRLSRPQSGDLAAKKIGEMAFRLYAAPDYLAATAAADWRFIGAAGAMAAAPQQAALLRYAAGRPILYAADHVDAQAAFAKAGVGVALLPGFLAEDDPGLTAADPAAPPLIREIWLVVHQDLQRAAAIRAVIDHLSGDA